jgi:hypothetical protein
MRHGRLLLVAAAATLLWSAPAASQDQILGGVVADKGTGTAIEGAVVAVQGKACSSVTDAKGVFLFSCQGGTKICASKVGYVTQCQPIPDPLPPNAQFVFKLEKARADSSALRASRESTNGGSDGLRGGKESEGTSRTEPVSAERATDRPHLGVTSRRAPRLGA